MLLIVLSSLVPGLFWLWYFNRYDVVEQEPYYKLGQCFLFGALAVVFALIWETPFIDLLQTTSSLKIQVLLSFLVVGLGEESFKFIATYAAVSRSAEFNEPMDGIVYSIATAIGFAVLENILYIASFGLAVAPLRGTIAALAHIAFSGLAGYYLGIAKFAEKPFSLLASGLVLASALHGIYDLFLITQWASPLLVGGFILALHYWLLVQIRRAVAASPFS